MDEVITCVCGNQSWVIGTIETRCSKCKNVLLPGEVAAEVIEVNKRFNAERLALEGEK